MINSSLHVPLGLMCGTFDPPHNGHLQLALTAADQLNLPKTLFVPVGQPTHKTTLTAAPLRQAMTERLVAQFDRFHLDTTDIDRLPPHYTATLIPLLQQKYPHHPLWLLLGADSLRDLPTWHRPEDILNSGCHIAVLPRPRVAIDWSELEQTLPHIRQKITLLDGELLDISSTALRHTPPDDAHSNWSYVPAAIHQYIKNHRLYQYGT